MDEDVLAEIAMEEMNERMTIAIIDNGSLWDGY